MWLLGGLLVAFIVVPVARLVTTSSPASLGHAAADPGIRGALLLSVEAAAITAVLATVLGVIQAVVDLPLVIPHTVAGIALLFVFGRTGWIGETADRAGLSFYGSEAGIIVAMLFVSAPFAVNSTRVALEAIDPDLERAARSLGATSLYTVRRVTLPLAARGVFTGAVLVYARSISEFGAVVIIAYYPATAPVEIYNLFLTSGLTDSASAAVLLLLVALATFLVLRTMASGWLFGGAQRARS
jgi:molybdate/tungstate transport system permease protein